MAATNYAAKANEQAELAKELLLSDESFSGPRPTVHAVYAQVHATLAVAYAELATYTATGNG